MNIVKKRGWVKNAAIVFLAVMLGLTFFSNTIRNRSLPEVAAQYTQSGSISARIRGSGDVKANESFEVKIGQPRTVSEILVDKGDEVQRGDVLIKFDIDISDELEKAQDDLRQKELELEKELLELSRPGGSLAAENAAVQTARDNLSDAQRALAILPPFSETALASARAVLNNAQAILNSAQAASNSAQAASNSAQAALVPLQRTADARDYDLTIAQIELDTLEAAEKAVPGSVLPADMLAAIQKRDSAETAFSLAEASLNLAKSNARAAATAAESAAAAATAALNDVTAAQNDITTIEANRDARAAANALVRDMQQALSKAVQDLADAQVNLGVDSSQEAIKIRELKRELEELQDKVEKLEKDGSITEYTSLVSGIVTSIDITAGNDAPAETPLITIEVVDRGYSLTFPVSAEQASRVAVGDQAEVDRGWWSRGEEIRATLTAIRNEPANPVAGRILNFAISGDVKSGDQLNLTLAQRSETFSIIVPNGAIRSDTNGDFVLVIESRNSPLGNRYIATRADINILASDDTNTAISGALSGWDFVITRASAPVDPGIEVRLVDNP